MLLILFGLPGAGKTYAGRLLRDEFGCFFHESDDDIPDDYRSLVAAGQVVSDERRDDYHRHMLVRIADLSAAHPRLAVAIPLLRHKHRLWIRDRFPAARFVLLECPPELWPTRLAGRQHVVGPDYAKKILPLYEPPELEHFTLRNDAEGAEGLRVQLRAVLTRLAALTIGNGR